MKLSNLAITFFLFFISCNNSQNQENNNGLWPPTEPFQTGYLKVSSLHQIYYEQCGNPDGKPVFVLHGGPGGGCWPVMRQFFNPEKFRIILHDQRGANRSKPFASIKENTTRDLIDDIEKLRKHLGVKKMMLVGGSWGSTLALAYCQEYPERVSDMVIRGIWTATKEEIDHFYHGGVKKVFPDVYDEFLASLPDSTIRPLPLYLYNLLMGEDAELRTKIANSWLKYEWRISDLNVDENQVNNWIEKNDAYAFSLIENYYMANNCFLQEGQIWENIHSIIHIPCIIINGRYDMPCPVQTAYRLHKNWPGSKLIIVEKGGHGGKAILNAIADAVRFFEP